MANVTVSRNDRELIVSPAQCELEAGDWIVWHFDQLRPGEMPCIRFHPTGSPEERFGPFQILEPSSLKVTGIGNSGQMDTYAYTAFILDELGVAAQSENLASVVNTSSEVDTSPIATILCHEGEINIAPAALKVELQQTALWYITGVPEGYFVTFHFEDFPDPMMGPFSSFGFSRGIGNAYLAIGTRYSGPFEGSNTGQVHYRVSLRRPDGSLVTGSHDPVIEPPGWPPSPG